MREASIIKRVHQNNQRLALPDNPKQFRARMCKQAKNLTHNRIIRHMVLISHRQSQQLPSHLVQFPTLIILRNFFPFISKKDLQRLDLIRTRVLQTKDFSVVLRRVRVREQARVQSHARDNPKRLKVSRAACRREMQDVVLLGRYELKVVQNTRLSQTEQPRRGHCPDQVFGRVPFEVLTEDKDPDVRVSFLDGRVLQLVYQELLVVLHRLQGQSFDVTRTRALLHVEVPHEVQGVVRADLHDVVEDVVGEERERGLELRTLDDALSSDLEGS